MRGICTNASRAVPGSIVAVWLLAVLGCGSSSSNQSPGKDAGSPPADATVSDDGSTADGGPGSDGSAPGCDGPCNAPPAGLLDPDYTTTWNPGILADTPTGNPLGPDGLPVRTTTCASVPVQSGDATSAIQSALDGLQRARTRSCCSPPARTACRRRSHVPSGVVLRGAGSDAASGTILVSTNGGPVLSIGTTAGHRLLRRLRFDSAAQPLLTQDATKETSTVTVASAAGFVAGDLALVDQADTAEVSEGDCTLSSSALANYGVSERVEIAAVSGNTLTLTTPLHWTFKTAQKAQISRVGAAADEVGGHREPARPGRPPRRLPGAERGRHRRLERRLLAG